MGSDFMLRRFFSKSMIHHFIKDNHNNFFKKVINNYTESGHDKTNKELIDEVYFYMAHHYRFEYYYKNVLLNRILLKKHNPLTTVAFTEFPIANSKADFLLINGKGKVYEIKTELDNLERIESQVNDYYKAFTLVEILTYKENVEKVKKHVPETVGITVLTQRGALSTVRKPVDNTSLLSAEVIFKILHKDEYENLLKNIYGSLPQSNDFEYYKECLKLFCQIDILDAQKKMLRELKSRVDMEKRKTIETIPESLRLLVYTDSKAQEYIGKLKPVLAQVYGG